MILLRHCRLDLALHELRTGVGRPLLLLHGLGERSPKAAPVAADDWPGPIYALDFSGHGDSQLSVGGGYNAEVLLGDVDAALAHLGSATIIGRGLGGYIALLIAGGRPNLVHGAAICDGPGLTGGGVGPMVNAIVPVLPAASITPDPWALLELSRDVRPPDYAAMYVRLAVAGSTLREPIAVCGRVRPPWLAATVDEIGVVECTLAEALDQFALPPTR